MRMKGQKSVKELRGLIVLLVEEILSLKREKEELRRELLEYAEHRPWCQWRTSNYDDRFPCTCGLSDLE